MAVDRTAAESGHGLTTGITYLTKSSPRVICEN
jgi:hypothetical protein